MDMLKGRREGALNDLPDRTGSGLGHEMSLQGRNLLKETDLTAGEFLYLVELGGRLRLQKRMGLRSSRLAGRNIALIFEKTSTGTRSAFEVAAHDEGAHVTYLGPEDSRLGRKEW